VMAELIKLTEYTILSFCSLTSHKCIYMLTFSQRVAKEKKKKTNSSCNKAANKDP
jgi:hypothetical protein